MQSLTETPSPWVFRWALAVTLLTFPLVWLGGLVTTHDAGMAVPDWPGTYGYNLFLYPWSAWLYGPFDLLVEHGHRQLGGIVGATAIILCVVARMTERRVWLRRCCYLLLCGIITQGILGGLRVLFDARTVALVHGCLGALLFAFGGFIVMASSKWWSSPPVRFATKWTWRFSLTLLLLSIVQLLVGAHLRHALPTWAPVLFMSLVHTHLTMAALISVVALTLSLRVACGKSDYVRGLRIPSGLLLAIVAAQVLLGLATWVANYATPWLDLTPWLARYTVQGKGFWESMIVTGHQATGSLLIVFSLWMFCRVCRRNEITEAGQDLTQTASRGDGSR